MMKPVPTQEMMKPRAMSTAPGRSPDAPRSILGEAPEEEERETGFERVEDRDRGAEYEGGAEQKRR